MQPQPKVLHRRVDVHGVQQSDYNSVDTPVGSGGRRDFLMGINENQSEFHFKNDQSVLSCIYYHYKLKIGYFEI